MCFCINKYIISKARPTEEYCVFIMAANDYGVCQEDRLQGVRRATL